LTLYKKGPLVCIYNTDLSTVKLNFDDIQEFKVERDNTANIKNQNSEQKENKSSKKESTADNVKDKEKSNLQKLNSEKKTE